MIDAHHHLWQYDPVSYPWITDQMGVLRRDFLMDDLRPLMASTGVSGLVTVQAQQTLEETRWLLEIAGACDEILAVVGWVPLVHPGVERTLERFAAHRKLRGVRHVLQEEPDHEYMLREDFNAGVSRLRAFGLTYDILIYERHLPQTLTFVDRHPDQVFVVDHVAKPRIRERVLSPWRELMRELARRSNVYCKLSGMITEADWHGWSEADLRSYVDVVLDQFGPRRLMFGSDWPVLTLGASYGQWVSTFRHLTAALSSDERAWIESRTAREAYGLSGGPGSA
jgi:L-fuconolactonase